MAVKFTNYAYSTLAASITSAATSLTVAAGHGARFPNPSGSDYFYATLESALLVREIVKVTARSTDTLTIVRAQDNSTASAFTAGDSVSLRLNAAAMTDAATDAVAVWAATTTPVETMWIPAWTMVPRTTNGAAYGTLEMTTNKNMVATLDFDTTTTEYAQFTVQMQKSWNEGTITMMAVWSHAATTTNFGVTWKLQAVAISNADTLDVAFGTAQGTVDTGGTTSVLYVAPESSAITIGGTPAELDYVNFQIYRDTADGGDTMAIDARLHGVTVKFTRNAWTDA